MTSCIDNSQQRIEGDWLGYERTFVADNDTMSGNFHSILSISKDSIQAINFKFIAHGHRDSISISSYILSENNLIVSSERDSPDTLAIDVLNETTLILSTSKNKYKYSRLVKSKTTTHKVEFARKMFTISDSTQIIDTIEFIDNSSILIYNSSLGRPNQIFEWRIRKYLDHEFLIIDSHEMPVFVLDIDTEDNVVFKREPNEPIEYSLNAIQYHKKFKRDMIIGEWYGKSNIPDNEVSFKFNIDSVQMNEFTGGEIRTGTYSLNLIGTKMFIFHEYAGEVLFYEIEKIRNDSMVLKRLAPIKDSFVLTRDK